MSNLANFKVDPKRFSIYKEVMTRQLRDFKAEQPHRHAIYYTSILLDSHAWTKEDLAEALEGECVFCVCAHLVCLSICLCFSICLCLCLSVCLSVCMSLCLPVSISVCFYCLSICRFVYIDLCPSVILVSGIQCNCMLSIDIEITADQLQAFIPVLLSRVHIEALIHGNLSRQVTPAVGYAQ